MEPGAPLCTPVPVSEISPARVVCRAPIKPLMAPVGPRAVFLSSLLSSGTTPSPPIDRLSLALCAAPGVLCLFGPGHAVQSGQTLTLTPGGDKSRFLSLYYRGHVVTRRCSSFAFLLLYLCRKGCCRVLTLASIRPATQEGGNLEVVAGGWFAGGPSNFGDRGLRLRFDPFWHRRRRLAVRPLDPDGSRRDCLS